MPTITYAQVEVAFDAYWAVVALEGDENRKAMRAALEAYERVRDVDRILQSETYVTGMNELREMQAENDARVEQGLKNLHRKLQKESL